MYASDHPGNAAVLRALLQAGADVNARSNEEGTALWWTVWIEGHGDPEMVQVLLAAGADVDAPGVLVHAAYYSRPLRPSLQHEVRQDRVDDLQNGASRNTESDPNLTLSRPSF